MRPLVRRARSAARLATWQLRALPTFMIIGAMKAGTTSLYAYLAQHPQVLPAARKEVRYFDVEYARGPRWYRSMFPTRAALGQGGVRRITGEASPYYLRHPSAAQRCAALLPDARLLVLLRNPTERAFSHYRHARRLGHETLPFAQALAAERQREQGEQREQGAPEPAGIDHLGVDAARHLSYVARGRYAEQLETWLVHYPREQLLVLTSEQLFTSPGETYATVLRFLDLPVGPPPVFDAYNAGAGSELEPVLRAELDAVFDEPNRRLAALLGWPDPWPR